MSLSGPIQLARKTAAAWAAQNPTLLTGQFAVSSDAAIPNDFKVGPGVWADLPYVLQTLANLKANSAHTHTAAEITDLNTVIAAAIAQVVDSSPSTLDTLNELAAALGDDPNFATTITTLISQKVATASIVDNLVSVLATVPLSANQGRVLKALIDANGTSITNLGNSISSGLNLKSDKLLVTRTPEVTASTVLTSADNGMIIISNVASAHTIQIPAIAGFNCIVKQKGAGQAEITASGGATRENRESKFKTAGQKAVVSVFCESATIVSVAGDVA